MKHLGDYLFKLRLRFNGLKNRIYLSKLRKLQPKERAEFILNKQRRLPLKFEDFTLIDIEKAQEEKNKRNNK